MFHRPGETHARTSNKPSEGDAERFLSAEEVLTFGVFAAVGSVFLEELTPFCTANSAILAFALAEIVKYVTQLAYVRS